MPPGDHKHTSASRSMDPDSRVDGRPLLTLPVYGLFKRLTLRGDDDEDGGQLESVRCCTVSRVDILEARFEGDFDILILAPIPGDLDALSSSRIFASECSSDSPSTTFDNFDFLTLLLRIFVLPGVASSSLAVPSSLSFFFDFFGVHSADF